MNVFDSVVNLTKQLDWWVVRWKSLFSIKLISGITVSGHISVSSVVLIVKLQDWLQVHIFDITGTGTPVEVLFSKRESKTSNNN